jgi:uncharacterized membrane protein YfcA
MNIISQIKYIKPIEIIYIISIIAIYNSFNGKRCFFFKCVNPNSRVTEWQGNGLQSLLQWFESTSGITSNVCAIRSTSSALMSKIDTTPINKSNSVAVSRKYPWKNIAKVSLGLFFLLIVISVVSQFITIDQLWAFAIRTVDQQFLFMLLVGFLAQMVDGALGMGYGVISTTLLLSGGLNPAVISGSIHTAEMFSSAASGFSHYRFGNINKKLFKTLLIPGIIGSVAGAVLLGLAGESYSQWLRPIIAVYTFLLGVRIISNAFKTDIKPKKIKRAGWLAGAGGFLDSFGGGGWGPLVTSTLIAKGKSPKYVIGSVSLTEFFVTFASALTFFIILGVSHLTTILGLICGGLIAAPLAAKLAGKLPVKKMFIAVGILVLISSSKTIWSALQHLSWF